jgi:hypothetical protein
MTIAENLTTHHTGKMWVATVLVLAVGLYSVKLWTYMPSGLSHVSAVIFIGAMLFMVVVAGRLRTTYMFAIAWAVCMMPIFGVH